MKLVLLVVSVIAVFTADSRDIPVKPDHDLHSIDEGDLPSPDDPSSTNENELLTEQLLDRDLHQELNNGSMLITDESQGFNLTGVHPPFPEEGKGPHEENIRACTDRYTSCPQWANAGYCSRTYVQWMSTNCPHSCNTCAPTGIINYRNGFQYEEIWNDKGSGGSYDVSIWRPSHLASGYCSLGDVARGSYSHSNIGSISVYGPHVAHPTGFTQVWNDKGSGARLDCAVYRMNAPYGYTCLGGVAMQSHSAQPDRNRYCCIQNDFVVPANTGQTYKDSGTGADEDMSLWTVMGVSGTRGISGNNFIPVNGYGRPSSARVLNGQKATKVAK